MSITLSNQWGEELLLLILGLKIRHKEGEVAVAEMLIPKEANIPPSTWVKMYYTRGDDKQVIFWGRSTGLSLELTDYTRKVEFLAVPEDVEQQHQRIVEKLQAEGDVHPAFMDPLHRHNPAEYLEAVPKLFCYHRVSHDVILSNIFEGRETIIFKDQILADGFSLKLKDSPLSGVRIHLSCEWVQQAEGEFNLMPVISSHFSQGIINTLTPQALLQTWPMSGQILGRSGYAVIQSSLQLFKPSQTGALGHYPTVTPLLGDVRYGRFWMKGKMIFSWTYRQKRKESIQIDVKHANQLLGALVKGPRVLKLRLNNIDKALRSSSQSTFLDKPEARSLLDHAMKIAQCHLGYSARAGELTLQVPFEEGLSLHLDQSAEVHHNSLPGGKVKGKIVDYALVYNGMENLANIKIALSSGVGVVDDPQQDLLIEEVPVEGIKDPEELTTADFLEALSIRNTAQDQIDYLRGADDPSLLPPELITQISFKLKDLKSQDVLERRLVAKPIVWSAPCHLSV